MSEKSSSANPMWGGHYASAPTEIMTEINASIGVDQALYAEDIAGSKAHVSMLMKQHIVSAADGEAILKGLSQVEAEIRSGTFTFTPALEDIHMHVEHRLKEIIGDAAGRLHTARSRNDQVALDFRLWVRKALQRTDGELKELQAALISRAQEYADTILPGFTHLQVAQPVTFGHHLMAYVEMFGRDRGRIADCFTRMDECPLGAAALAGTSFPIDREMTAELLGFSRPTANSLDTVSDRDFALEALSAASIAAVHLSRFAEELVLWASRQFGFMSLSEAFTTGSSIMPQKRNPDAAELVRGKAGRIFGSLQSLLVLLKGLPLTYSKDMQEDKETTFLAFRDLSLCLRAMAGMVKDLTANPDAMRHAALSGFSTATDLADWLVRVLKLPFRDAHHVTGKIVRLAEDKSCRLDELSLAQMQSVEPRITQDVFTVLSLEHSVKSRSSFGGTAPDNVRAAITAARKKYGL